MPSIWDVAKAVRDSDLPAPARHIMNTLGLMATVETAAVPAEYGPSLTSLARITGLSRAAVAEHLKALEAAGWVRRDRPPVAKARAEKARTQYRLRVPTSPGGGLVQEVDYPTSPGHGLASPGGGLELVQELDGASPGAGHVTTKSTTRTTNKPSDAPRPRSAAKPRTPKEPDPEVGTKANAVVAAYIDGARGAGLDKPTGRLIARVGKDAKRLLLEGVTPEKLRAAAEAMGAAGWHDLDVQLQRVSAAHNGRHLAAVVNGHRPFRNPIDPHAYEGDL